MTQRFLIVEDHPLFAEALLSVIRNCFPEVELVHARLLDEARSYIDRQSFDLVLLDLLLPDAEGFKGLIELRLLLSKTPILVNSALDEHDVIHNAFVCGASGFVPKTAGRFTIVRSIRTVLAGELALPDSYLPPNPDTKRKAAPKPCRLNCLTPQQLRILQMLCRGMPNKQIAPLLNINVTTVKAHTSEILRKLSVASRTQAVLKVSRLSFAGMQAFCADERPNNIFKFDRPAVDIGY